MKYILATVMTIVVGSCHLPLGRSDTFDFVDAVYSSDVTSEQLAAAGTWTDENRHPPVSARQAIRISSSELKKAFDSKKYPQWMLLPPQLALVRNSEMPENENWFWSVRYEAAARQGVVSNGTPVLEIPVLMDGSLIAPFRETRKSLFGPVPELDPEPPAVPENQSWSIRSDFIDGEYETTLKLADLNSRPAWPDKSENPPLSPRRAIEIAQSVVDGFSDISDFGDWQIEIDEVRLRQFTPQHWVWIVHYDCKSKVGGQTGPGTYLDVVVLMDGTSIRPTKLDQ
jgi:hypothetical protein